MSEPDLRRLLQSVGLSVFVDYYHAFADPRHSAADLVEMLPASYELSARRTRVSKARRIFRENRQAEALRLIGEATRVDPAVARRARLLLQEG